MRYLITGGCGFIGSHLTETLLKSGNQVTILDNLTTGRIGNIQHVESHPDLKLLVGSITDEELVHEAIRDCDAVYHFASAVGVRLIMDQPVESINTIVTGTQIVLKFANRYRKPILLTSTSEVYGKSQSVPFDEDGDRLEGPTTKHRWAYACAKALDEFIAMAYWKTTSLPVIVVRLFNTVGPRQTGQYGMVIPNFVQQAIQDGPLRVHGDGKQTRCFCHVADIVSGLEQLMHCKAAYGQVVNLGSTEEISMHALAQRIVERVGSKSIIELVPYQQVFGDGFEDMLRRVPKITKVNQLIGWKPQRNLANIIDDVAAQFRS
jgi:UDP-glucose 4-epimerase